MSVKDSILNAVDLPTESLVVPRWSTEILVRAAPIASPAYVGYMTSTRDKSVVVLNQQGVQVVAPREENVRRNIGAVILCAMDPETGKRLFEWSDAKDLREKHWNSVLLIAAKAFELAGGDGPDDVSASDSLVRLITYGVTHDWDAETLQTLAALEPMIDVSPPDDEPVEGEITDPETAAALAAVPDVSEADEDAPDGPLEEA